MALFKSNTIAAASGSVGGTTYTRNRFGMVMRVRSIPVNPNTSAQQEQRAAFSAASAGWRGLDAGQRATWNVYAAATPVKNSLGDTVYLTGAQHYVATNSFRDRVGLATLTTAPSTPGRIDLGNPAVDYVVATGWTIASLATAVNGSTVAVFVGDPQSAGVSFFAGPYQMVDKGVVAAGALPTTVLTGRNGLAISGGMRLPVRLAGVGTDGRLTTIWSGLVTATV